MLNRLKQIGFSTCNVINTAQIIGSIISAIALLSIVACSTALSKEVATNPINEMTVELRKSVIKEAASLIEERYAIEEKGAAISRALLEVEGNGRFDGVHTHSGLSNALTEFLKPYDVHFDVSWSSETQNQVSGKEINPARTGEDNYGFDSFQLLSGNIAYLKISNFAFVNLENPDDPAVTKAEAMLHLLDSANGAIIDLRECRGGTPEMVQFIFSHFLTQESFLIDKLYWRPDGKVYEYWTIENLKYSIPEDRPIIILISGRTASACEAFAYNFQAFSRGTIVGLSSRGAANPGSAFELSEGFSIFISVGLVENAATKTNWGAEGVIPDISANYQDALHVSHIEIAKQLLSEGGKVSKHASTTLAWMIERFRAEEQPISLSVEEIRGYAGDYGTRVVFEESGKLFYRRSSQEPDRELIPIGRNLFARVGDDSLRYKFEFNSDREVSALTIMTALGSANRYKKSR